MKYYYVQLDHAIRKESITINGKEIDLSPLKEKAFRLTAQNIISEVSTLWNIWEIETILITGGGGIALYDYLSEQINNIMLVRSGQFSIMSMGILRQLIGPGNMIVVRFRQGRDDELREWYESLPKGDRSRVVREILEGHIKGNGNSMQEHAEYISKTTYKIYNNIYENLTI